MRRMTLLTLFALSGSVASAQTYECNWSVVGIAGGSMSSTSYHSDATAGQTAIGQTASTSYQAFIGFWQIDTAYVGISEDASWLSPQPRATMLCAPFPNPCRSVLTVRYALASETQVRLQLFDLTGRTVATIVKATQKPGRYEAHWDGADCAGHALPAGVCFCRLEVAGETKEQKVILLR